MGSRNTKLFTDGSFNSALATILIRFLSDLMMKPVFLKIINIGFPLNGFQFCSVGFPLLFLYPKFR